MFRRLGILGAALALFVIAGGHWAMLQSVAWAGMLADYSQRSGSIVTGFEQTFDGRHACELCRAIQLGKSKGGKGGGAAFVSKDDTKVKARLSDEATWRAPAADEVESCKMVPGRVVVRTEPPPTPPPRLAFYAA